MHHILAAPLTGLLTPAAATTEDVKDVTHATATTTPTAHALLDGILTVLHLNDAVQHELNTGTGGKRHCAKTCSGVRMLDNTQTNEEGKAWQYRAMKRGKVLLQGMHDEDNAAERE